MPLLGRSDSSNPGAATPHSLYSLYKNQAAVTANPYTLRQFTNIKQKRGAERCKGVGFSSMLDSHQDLVSRQHTASRKRADSPPRASFRLVTGNTKRSESSVFQKSSF